MDCVKIKVPVNSLASAKIQISCGADEIYLGMFSPEWFANLSFSHRGRKNLSSDRDGCITTDEELKAIIDYAHSHGVTVSFTANFFNLPDTDVNEVNGKTLSDGYLEYVETAIRCGVDSIIVATLSEVLIIRKSFPDVKVVASCLFMISNEEYVKYLYSLGVKSFFLPHDTNIEEIRAIRSVSEDIEIGVFAHLSCAMLSGGCHLYHKFGEAVDLGYPCRNKYTCKNEDGEVEICHIFDFNCDCALCQVKNLIDAGVNSLKIIGRSSSYKITSRMTKVYKKMVQTVLSNGDCMAIRQEIINEETWWKSTYCDNHACKYSKNGKFTDYLIG